MSDVEMRLTALTGDAGGPVTVGADRLSKILSALELVPGENSARVSSAPSVYQVSDDLAIVHAVAQIAPVVDDPHTFGAIAAAHVMGEVYAAGAEVVMASSLGGAPDSLPAEVLSRVLQGAADKLAEAGVMLTGGQLSVEAAPRFGLALVGRAAPSRVLGKGNASVGDVVVLTKALGTGIVTEAARRGRADAAHVARAVESMLQLNRTAMQLAVAAGAHAMTVVGAYGILGSALAIAEASGAQVAIRAGDMPLLPGALGYAGSGIDTPAMSRNFDELSPRAEIEEELPGAIIRLISDPQTSGGLMFTLPAADAGAVLTKLREAGYQAGVVGSVLPGSGAAVDP